MRTERERLAGRVQFWLTVVTVLTNLVGAVVVFALLLFVIPRPDGTTVGIANMIGVPVYIGFALVVGAVWGTRRLLPLLAWIEEERAPTTKEQRTTLRAPVHLLVVEGALWLGGAVIFAVINGLRDVELIPPVAFTVLIGGVTTSSAAYLLNERALRPAAAIALSSNPPDRPLVPGVTARSMLAWLLGSAMPALGLIAVAIFTLAGREVSSDRLAITILGLGGISIAVGLLTTALAARATAAAVQSVREALTGIEAGDLDVRTPVFDGTEVGLLQAGFNRMAEGLAERERIRDLFGRHVGETVAESAIEGGRELGGEVREVGVVFVDVIGSTSLAATRPATEVVDVLNRFFAVVVEVVHRHGGIVNKFEGDAALAVFGAPVPLADPAGSALGCLRELGPALAERVPECAAGAGASFGAAVAGNVGAEERYEYTVIGDPVNEAARLTELAKDVPGRIVASGAAVDAADPSEAACWDLGEEVLLRGRTAPTRLAHPARW
ncbi:MAG: adenylate/guanylate cyclase domain-containing protein [Actinomycetota bacterium]|nr:adenylate/guanylate cyclase domain-containing protein [Actinomycetota bacterium]